MLDSFFSNSQMSTYMILPARDKGFILGIMWFPQIPPELAPNRTE